MSVTWPRRFRAWLPAVFPVVLALTAGAVQAADNSAAPAVSTADASPGPTAETRSSLFSLYRPNYLIIGPENSPVAGNVTSKFQLSLKYDIGSNLYLAYTQRVYWDITRDSEPILDMSVQPELFYLWRPAPEHTGRWDLRDARAGFVHESNGKDGSSSRSWTRLYLEPHFRWDGLFLEPRVWTIIERDEQNRNITDYYGYADLMFGYETASRQRFTVTGRHGSKHGNVQLDATLPLQSLWANGNMHPWLYAQAWAGYGETLLYYNVRTYAFRIGIEFHP